MKPKTCRICKTKYEPSRPMQVVCSPLCAIEYSNRQKNAQERIRIASERTIYLQAKERVKSRAQWLRETQTVFNAYCRLRDKNEPCISCGRHHQGQYHAGHYRTVGSHPELRFNELNVHKQCSVCNNHKSGNIVDYRINLIKKIGVDKVEWLEGNHEPKKYSINELKEIKSTYKLKLKELAKGQ